LIDEILVQVFERLVFVERGFIKKAMYSRGHWRVTY
jgi:hypothetical protein